MCKEAPRAILELEAYGMPFSRTAEGKIYQVHHLLQFSRRNWTNHHDRDRWEVNRSIMERADKRFGLLALRIGLVMHCSIHSMGSL
jgi:succinate dehydrogenase/fumarate reductase flavoprotein subunit